jgi:ADP-heptose:LPS heptosyltransferase
VAAPERWDEACFAVPAMRAILASGLELGVICREDQHEFWKCVKGLEVLSFTPKAKPKAVAALIRDKWQAALLWEPGLAADAVKLAAVPRRLGPALGKLKRRLTHPFECSENRLEHRVRFYLSAVETMGIPTGNPEFFTPTRLGIEARAGTVLLCPDSDFGPSHEWLLDRWTDLAQRLIQNGCHLTVAGLTGGRSLGQTLAEALDTQPEFFEATRLAAALPMLAAHPRVIAADGSLPHLAALAGAACVTLFGPNDPVWKRPLGRHHTVVRRHVECAPCLLGKCPMDGRCQRELECERVWAALQESQI